MNLWQTHTIRDINELIRQMEFVQFQIAHGFIMRPTICDKDVSLTHKIKEARESLVQLLEEVKSLWNPDNEKVLSRKEWEEMMDKRAKELKDSGFKIEVNPGPDDNISYTYRRKED